jgi:hypothetical protein
MAKSKKQSEAVLIKGFAERFRKLPDTLCPHTKFEGEQEWQKTPAEPIELWLIRAGQLLRLVLRYDCVFTDDRQELIRGFNDRKSAMWSMQLASLMNSRIGLSIFAILLRLIRRLRKGKGAKTIFVVDIERAEIWLWREVIKTLRTRAGLRFPLDYLKTFTDDCNLLANVLEREAEDLETGMEYTTINVANRTIIIGVDSFTITSERVWDFIKDLIFAAKSDDLVPIFEGPKNNKNNIDQLRRIVGGPDNLKKLVTSMGDGYKLSPTAKVLNSGQVGIKKTY